MPRQSVVLHNWTGGIADDPSSKDLKEDELVQAVNIDVAREGQIGLIGEFVKNTTYNNSYAKDLKPGYGLFAFASDYTSSGGKVPTEYIAVAGKTTDNQDKVVEIFEIDGTVLSSMSTTGGSLSRVYLATGDTTEFEPIFYYVDGGLRISDGNYNEGSSKTKWIGYVENAHFADSTRNTTTHALWVQREAEIQAPTRGIFDIEYSIVTVSTHASIVRGTNTTSGTDVIIERKGVDSKRPGFNSTNTFITEMYAIHVADQDAVTIAGFNSSSRLVTSALVATWAGDVYEIYPPAGKGVNIHFYEPRESIPNSPSVVANYNSGYYRVAASYVYADGQESKLYIYPGMLELSSRIATGLAGPYVLEAQFQATAPFDSYIDKIKIYIGEDVSTLDPVLSSTVLLIRDISVQQWNLAITLDLEKGMKIPNQENYLQWSDRVAATVESAPNNKYLMMQNRNWGLKNGPETYESETGFTEGIKDSNPDFKTVAVTNRIAYAGNVKINSKARPDSILKSLPNKFDSFDEERRLDIAINDGDDVIRLEEYADRILEFKRKNLYIINISQDIEFLESQHDLLGVTEPYHVKRTEYGIAWFNEYGCYLYDGNNIIDLLLDRRNPTRRKISLASWKSFLGTSPSIGYDGQQKKLFITNNSTGILQTKIYNLLEGSWIDAKGKMGTSGTAETYSNFVVDSTNKCSVMVESNYGVYSYDPVSVTNTTDLTIETPILDLGHPGINKRFYYVYITHKNAGTMPIYYKTDGDTKLYAMSPALFPASTSWITTRFAPANSSEARYVKDMAIVIDKSVAISSSLGFNDMEIIYRTLGMR